MTAFGQETIVGYGDAGSPVVHAFNQGCVSPADIFSDGSDGAGEITGNTNWTMDPSNYWVKKQFRSLSISNAAQVTASEDSRLMLVLVQGDCSITGSGTSLNMDARGRYQSPAGETFVRALLKNYIRLLGRKYCRALAKKYSCPAVGASGGAACTVAGSPNNGVAGVNGQTGGGGSGGRSQSSWQPGGAGAAGSATVGGSGGGAGGYDAAGGDAAAYGGPGGNGGAIQWTDSDAAGGGAGNDPGTTVVKGGATYSAAPGGGGGTLILLVGGTLTIGPGAVVSADGSRGTNVSGSWCGAAGGGGRRRASHHPGQADRQQRDGPGQRRGGRDGRRIFLRLRWRRGRGRQRGRGGDRMNDNFAQ